MSNRMDERLWSTLPEEVQENIVAFLPFPALSRFRGVSKKYNAWIFSENFIKLCAQLPLREAQVWMTCYQSMVCSYSTGFKVSAGAKLLQGSTHEGMLPYFGPQWERRVQAALGCLLFVDCTKRVADGTACDFVHHEVLCDFSTMTCTRLPQPIVRRNNWYGCFSHVMFGLCGEDTGAFKIAIMDLAFYGDPQPHTPYTFQVYNSVTQSWKELHPNTTIQFDFADVINCTFIFDKVFCLFRMLTRTSAGVYPGRHAIVAFNTNTEKYESTMTITVADKRTETRDGFVLGASYAELASMKLMAVNGRLHLTGWLEGKVLYIFEVDLPNMQLTKITELPISSMPNMTYASDVQIEGHGDCILLWSRKAGNVLVYDCCSKKWHWLSDCPHFRVGVLSKFHFFMENGKE